MEYDKIKDLINTVDNSRLMDFELELKDDIYIRMNKNTAGFVNNDVKADSPNSSAVSHNVNTPVSASSVSNETSIVKENISEPITIIPEDKVEIKEGNMIISPMVGVFYSSASPDKPAFKNIGDKVKKGDVVCIIEAMKIMNEITSKFDGEIAEIFVSNEDMVEYNQPLFRIV